MKFLFTSANKEKIEVIGASVPVWFYRGNTSEPAKEIFSKYILTNLETNEAILRTKEGYQINLPQKVDIRPLHL
jgi:hypothetical protein